MPGILLLLGMMPDAAAFCGTYVGQAGAELYNRASQVAIARQGSLTTLTLANDYQGDARKFALVLPVPEILREQDVAVVDPELFSRLDAYSAPRLVEYTCDNLYGGWRDTMAMANESSAGGGEPAPPPPEVGGVTVEAEYAVGGYEIVILSAEQSAGLLEWLQQEGYALSGEAEDLLGEYIEAGSYFLAAKVSLEAAAQGWTYLPPLQIRYEAAAWGLPVRLGVLNSPGEQDLTMYVLTDAASGEAGIANYPEATVEAECLWDEGGEFSSFYADQVADAMEEVGGSGWLREYAWAPYWCDPCADDPLTGEEMAALGFQGDAYNAFFTRLHLRLTPETAGQDLSLYASGMTDTAQIRYVVHKDELEEAFPVCGSGYAADPGSCPAERPGWLWGRSCSTAGGAPTLGALLGLLAGLSRRRSGR